MLECQVCHFEFDVERDDGMVQPDGTYICEECCNDIFSNDQDEDL
jgi:hypothetical protein